MDAAYPKMAFDGMESNRNGPKTAKFGEFYSQPPFSESLCDGMHSMRQSGEEEPPIRVPEAVQVEGRIRFSRIANSRSTPAGHCLPSV
jgi:hypothetical protein